MGSSTLKFKTTAQSVQQAHLIYTLNGNDRYEEWFQTSMQSAGADKFAISLPEGTTHYFINLIDENQFLVSYPSLKRLKRGQGSYTQIALKASR